MMNRGQLNLQWDAYSDHLQGMLQEIISNDSFSDVTLVTDDKKQLKAHRNILSSCSSVFKEIFQIGATSNHQVIYLRGIQHSEIESILHFMYLGEAKVDRMKEFIEVANNLDIRGLCDFGSWPANRSGCCCNGANGTSAGKRSGSRWIFFYVFVRRAGAS